MTEEPAQVLRHRDGTLVGTRFGRKAKDLWNARQEKLDAKAEKFAEQKTLRHGRNSLRKGMFRRKVLDVVRAEVVRDYALKARVVKKMRCELAAREADRMAKESMQSESDATTNRDDWDTANYDEYWSQLGASRKSVPVVATPASSEASSISRKSMQSESDAVNYFSDWDSADFEDNWNLQLPRKRNPVVETTVSSECSSSSFDYASAGTQSLILHSARHRSVEPDSVQPVGSDSSYESPSDSDMTWESLPEPASDASDCEKPVTSDSQKAQAFYARFPAMAYLVPTKKQLAMRPWLAAYAPSERPQQATERQSTYTLMQSTLSSVASATISTYKSVLSRVAAFLRPRSPKTIHSEAPTVPAPVVENKITLGFPGITSDGRVMPYDEFVRHGDAIRTATISNRVVSDALSIPDFPMPEVAVQQRDL
ncbi:hypothetical protein EJ08DRAFT_701352 [Tothia fuscella]|uniref:Uncharacterized protein n=1 Tax=Tothia fuscella TaxID=1048955 RepID=A0A9P4TUW5_9PEZI|nr:hypothetical protein EJ08DRAFT_701352 [Tothia fuscella]